MYNNIEQELGKTNKVKVEIVRISTILGSFKND